MPDIKFSAFVQKWFLYVLLDDESFYFLCWAFPVLLDDPIDIVQWVEHTYALPSVAVLSRLNDPYVVLSFPQLIHLEVPYEFFKSGIICSCLPNMKG